MTDDDKALVERLRSGRWLGETTCGPAADRIETLNAMLAAAEECLGDQLAARKEQADRIEAQAAEIERKEVEIAALWALLDDIDTLDDVCKGDDYAFRIWVRPLQQKRFNIMSGERFDPLSYAARAALGETE